MVAVKPQLRTRKVSITKRSRLISIGHAFKTVAGGISFAADAEWAKARIVFTQFRNVSGNDINQFRDTTREAIL